MTLRQRHADNHRRRLVLRNDRFNSGTWLRDRDAGRMRHRFGMDNRRRLFLNDSRNRGPGVGVGFESFSTSGNLIGGTVQEASHVFRRLQTGLVQNYALLMLVGVFVFVSVYLFVR